MPLVTTEKMLKDAQKGHYAIGAFNIENMEMAMAVVEAAEELNSPVILQTTPSTVDYAGLEMYLAMVTVLAKNASIPIALHLDHGNSFALCMKALRAGYTSIMIDGSHENLEHNIELSRRVVDACYPSAISVEAELGKVGGKEDDLEGDDENPYTKPEEAIEFVERVKISSLAVGIGTAHGVYKGEPNIAIDVLKAIKAVVHIPLVLHGTSGVADDVVRDCIKNGICKVNYATDLRIAFTRGIKEVLAENPNTIDPKKYGKVAKEYVKEYVKDKMKVCGSVNKAK